MDVPTFPKVPSHAKVNTKIKQKGEYPWKWGKELNPKYVFDSYTEAVDNGKPVVLKIVLDYIKDNPEIFIPLILMIPPIWLITGMIKTMAAI